MRNKTNACKKQLFSVLFAAIALWIFAPKQAHSITLLTINESIAKLFPDNTSSQPLTIKASASNGSALKSRLSAQIKSVAGKQVLAQVLNMKEYTFHICRKDGALLGSILILEGPGKWGPIKFAVSLDADGKINSAAVMEYKETRGRPVASHNFLKQFKGKSESDPMMLGKDIQAVSGATVSSEAACAVMKAATALYMELKVYDFLKEPKNQK